MKKFVAMLMVSLFMVSLVAGVAVAAEEKAADKDADKVIQVKGIIVDYDLKASTITVKIDGKDMVFHVKNKKAMGKLETRLFPDDEVKIKYVVEDGKNVIKGKSDLKGTKPGC